MNEFAGHVRVHEESYLVCGTCSDTFEGGSASEHWMIAKARAAGWRVVGGEVYCSQFCSEREEDAVLSHTFWQERADAIEKERAESANLEKQTPTKPRPA